MYIRNHRQYPISTTWNMPRHTPSRSIQPSGEARPNSPERPRCIIAEEREEPPSAATPVETTTPSSELSSGTSSTSQAYREDILPRVYWPNSPWTIPVWPGSAADLSARLRSLQLDMNAAEEARTKEREAEMVMREDLIRRLAQQTVQHRSQCNEYVRQLNSLQQRIDSLSMALEDVFEEADEMYRKEMALNEVAEGTREEQMETEAVLNNIAAAGARAQEASRSDEENILSEERRIDATSSRSADHQPSEDDIEDAEAGDGDDQDTDDTSTTIIRRDRRRQPQRAHEHRWVDM